MQYKKYCNKILPRRLYIVEDYNDVNLNSKKNMLVIHPEDQTTSMLKGLYEGAVCTLISKPLSRRDMRRLLRETEPNERVLLLGHGSANGLFHREDPSSAQFDSFIISHAHAYPLRKHGANLVGIWCHAADFARRERLQGLFSGMIISDMEEAQQYHVHTTQEELDRENIKLVERLRSLLDEGISLREIPQRMLELDDAHTPLTEFNYKNFYYL